MEMSDWIKAIVVVVMLWLSWGVAGYIILRVFVLRKSCRTESEGRGR
jgi:hypothetical protein